jgi:hypothetical protein
MEEKEKNFPTDIFPTVRKKFQRTYFSSGENGGEEREKIRRNEIKRSKKGLYSRLEK